MGSDWEEVQLQDVVSKLGDGLHGTPKYSENGEYYFINGNNLENGQIVFKEKTKKVDYTQYLKYKKELNERTLLVSINGTIGNVAYYNDEKVVLGKSACYFNLKDDIDKGYVRYVLSGHYFQSYINAFATGTTIKNVSLKSMREFSFPLPPLPKQKAIAHILGSLDDKIELNRQMNETLEAMAQALFKSWFVDFDPVIDNALAAGKPIPDELLERAEQRKNVQHSDTDNHAIRALFPDAFELTDEMGWIPEGWAVKNLTEISDFQNGFAFYTTGYSDSGYKVVDLANISTSGRFIETHRDKHVSSEIYNLAKHEKHHLQINDIVMAMTDITQAMGILGKCGKIYESNKYILNQRIGRIRVKESININFLLTYLNSTYQLNFLKTRVLGTVQKYVNTTHIKEMNFVVPQNAVMNKFGNIVDPIFNKMRIADEENQTLAKLRDTLLPKLLSGELRISEAAAIVDEV
jgi:type I restriction enzyme S subunit